MTKKHSCVKQRIVKVDIYIYADTHLTVSAHGLSLSVWIQFILLCAALYEVWDDSFRAARLDRVKLTAELLLA